MSKFARLLGAVLLAAALSAGFAGAPRAEPLRIAFSDWPGWVPWEIAKEKGLFEKNGVDVELVWMDYVPSMQAFAAGKVDGVSCTNGDALVTGATSNKPAVAVLVNDYSNGNDMLIAKPGIDSVAGLKGKKVAVEVGFVDHLMLLKALESAHLSESDVSLVNMPTNDLPQALASGSADAIGAWQPSSGQALKIVPGAKTIYTSADVPGLIYDLLYAAPESLATRHDDWMKVVRTWYDVVAFMRDPANETEMLRILSARVGLKPAEYQPLLAGTHILSLEEAAARLSGGPDKGLNSVAGSNEVVDAFNVKYKVYAKPEAKPSYIDASLTLAVAKERGIALP